MCEDDTPHVNNCGGILPHVQNMRRFDVREGDGGQNAFMPLLWCRIGGGTGCVHRNLQLCSCTPSMPAPIVAWKQLLREVMFPMIQGTSRHERKLLLMIWVEIWTADTKCHKIPDQCHGVTVGREGMGDLFQAWTGFFPPQTYIFPNIICIFSLSLGISACLNAGQVQCHKQA